MTFHKTLIALVVVTLNIGCGVGAHKPLEQFEVEPYTRNIDLPIQYGDKIVVVLDPMIQSLQLTRRADGSILKRFSFTDYRQSLEASLTNMLEGTFKDVEFLENPPTNSLVLEVHRMKPLLTIGESIGDILTGLEFSFDYDMSLSLDGKTLANATALNAHPISTLDTKKRSWRTVTKQSLTLILEDCYNELFVRGLAEN